MLFLYANNQFHVTDEDNVSLQGLIKLYIKTGSHYITRVHKLYEFLKLKSHMYSYSIQQYKIF
jgi:hypothetical protein